MTTRSASEARDLAKLQAAVGRVSDKPGRCAHCDLWHQKPTIGMYFPDRRPGRVFIYRLCAVCSNLIRRGLGEQIKEKIERDLDALVDADITDLPNGGQLYAWPRPAA